MAKVRSLRREVSGNIASVKDKKRWREEFQGRDNIMIIDNKNKRTERDNLTSANPR
jgi:hypothetical protein